MTYMQSGFPIGTLSAGALRLSDSCKPLQRLWVNEQTVLDYARGNVSRRAASFTSERLPEWLIKWRQLLAGPLDELLEVLAADTASAARLRTTSPFVGLLTLQERLEILHRVDPEMARTLELFMLTYGQHPRVSAARGNR